MVIADEILQRIKKVIAVKEQLVALHEPSFSGNEWNYVKECLDTGWVSSVGSYVDQFEKGLADFTGARYAIAVVNGTAALHMAYVLSGVTAGDEVLVPTVTFVGTINPIIYCNAIPHFLDTEQETLGLDVNVLDDYLQDIIQYKNNVSINRLTGRPIRALCVMHTLGHPVDLDALAEICLKYHLVLIEDAAEALGSYYKGTHVGNRGLLGTLSFNGNKIITTGGGGAILTNDKMIAKRAKHITTTAKLPHAFSFQHDEVGYNYRLPNINAALGCAQLEKISQFLQAKRQLAEQYQRIFADFPSAKMMKEPPHSKSNYWLNALVLENSYRDEKNAIIELLIKNNMMVRPLWNLQHTLPMYFHCPKMPLPIAENMQKRLIKFPSSAKLSISHGVVYGKDIHYR
ncbi:MAG: DegT/DnrJ/EryC1/StrS aminotransferase [uncultured bacterium]|nr:MAG: DegT/DnrJ/EryC1/StrS aminotransferase [uncultured bacterium]